MRLLSRDEYELDSGRRFYANRGIIGIDTDGTTLSYGYDGYIDGTGLCAGDEWTSEERKELVLFMVKQWLDWMEKR